MSNNTVLEEVQVQNHSILTNVKHLIVTPFLYVMVVPLAFLDASLFLYEQISFRILGISIVPRKEYFVIDRHRLSYLSGLQKVNCVYCGYANSLASYSKEIIARTEEFWCPIKHDTEIQDPHSKYDLFLEYGDMESFMTLADEKQHLKFKKQK